MHKNLNALIAFYALIVVWGINLVNLQSLDVDFIRAIVIKNFVMFFPMMGFMFLFSSPDDDFKPWKKAFIETPLSLTQKISKGRPLLFVTAYYLLWAYVEWHWPIRMSK